MTLAFPSPTDPHESMASVLLGYLDFFRESVIVKESGLTEAQTRGSRVPSGWSPLSLLRHLTWVELRWIVWGFEGQDVPDPWADEQDGRWFVPDGVSRVDVVADLRAQGEHTRRVVTAHELTDVGQPGPRWDGAPPATLHRVLLHLIQEHARHLGHLDVVRELTDGHIGE